MNQTINTDQSINNISGGSVPPSKNDLSGSVKSANGEHNNMGIIEEEESLDFSSSVRSLFQGHRMSSVDQPPLS